MPTAWTQLTPNQTIIRAHHIAELRTALTAELTRRGLAVRATYTDDVEDMRGKPIRAIYVQEIVDKLQNIKTASYVDNPIVANKTVVKALHQEEIRTMINVLETAPQVGGVTTCNAACTGLCVSCSGTCTGGCTSCVDVLGAVAVAAGIVAMGVTGAVEAVAITAVIAVADIAQEAVSYNAAVVCLDVIQAVGLDAIAAVRAAAIRVAKTQTLGGRIKIIHINERIES